MYKRQESSNKTLTWVSMDPSIAKVDSNGTVTAVAEGTVEILSLIHICKGCAAHFDNVAPWSSG